VTPGRIWPAAAVACAIVLAAYLPDLGHGFIKDDLHWIRTSRVADTGDVLRLFGSNVGFYRPLTALTFAGDYAISGLAPFAYGVTNFAIFALDAVLLFALARTLALPHPAALFAAAAWALNFHAVNMALLWISGRTSLLVTLFALATAHASLRRRPLVAGAFAFAAMLCKEEAVVLPILFALFLTLEGRMRLHSTPAESRSVAGDRVAARESRPSIATGVISQVWPMVAALVIYGVLRARSGAFGATDAPVYYQFSFLPAVLLRNAAEYADRSATTVVVAVLILFAVAGAWQRVMLTVAERRAILLAAVWVPATFALTVFLPVRSSLYALLPSVGTALAGAAFVSGIARARPRQFGRAATVLLVIATLLVPVYRVRNRRWVEPADLTGRVLTVIAGSGTRERVERIVLLDDPGADVSLDSAFGTLFPDAVALTLGEQATGHIVQPGDAIATDATQVYRLKDGRLVPAGVNP
jgi:hypothetical protein